MRAFSTSPEPRALLPEGSVSGGALSGMLAGLAMAAFAAAAYGALGYGAATPLEEIACAVHGVDALVLGGPAIASGLVLHLAISGFWGVVFAAILPRGSTAWTALWAGVLFGIGVWAIMTYGALPWINEIMLSRAELLADWFFYRHLVFGASLLATPALRGWAGRKLYLPSERRPVGPRRVRV